MIPIAATIRASLKALPWRAIVTVAGAVCLFAVGWLVNGWRLGADIADLHAARQQDRAERAQQLAQAVEAGRAEEQRRTAAQAGIANAAKKEAEDARADARAAHAAAVGLRQQASALAGRGDAVCAAAPGDSAPAFDASRMLADVLSRIDERAGVLAEYADAAHIAGQACERSYDALMSKAR
jgi:hypothetical protein